MAFRRQLRHAQGMRLFPSLFAGRRRRRRGADVSAYFDTTTASAGHGSGRDTQDRDSLGPERAGDTGGHRHGDGHGRNDHGDSGPDSGGGGDGGGGGD
jgi:hypothetical protein